MKKPPSKLREEISRLQEQLKSAETKEAERIGRLALKAGLGELEIADTDIIAAFGELAARFRKASPRGGKASSSIAPGAGSGQSGEA